MKTGTKSWAATVTAFTSAMIGVAVDLIIDDARPTMLGICLCWLAFEYNVHLKQVPR